MRHFKSSWIMIAVALIAVGCANQKEPAQKAVASIESAVAALREDAAKYAPDDLQSVDTTLAGLKAKLASSYIVDKSSMPKGIVAFGCIVTVKDIADGVEEKYQFVGPGEEDYSGDVLKILTSSPLAKAMLGKKPGEQVDVPLPKGTRRMEVVAISES